MSMTPETNVAQTGIGWPSSNAAAEWMSVMFEPPLPPLPQWWTEHLHDKRGADYVGHLERAADFIKRITS